MKPLKFKPILKQTIWGGDKIVPFKHLESDMKQVGESWELSGVKGNVSTVDGGEFDGQSLNDLVIRFKDKLVGRENYMRFGDEFPLLIKFIDARKDLSIQVHPTDEIAKRQGKDRGKTEMWYIMKSDDNASLRAGLKQKITSEEYKAMVENDTICDAIAEYKVKEGDCFFLPAGRIHSIGTGCFLAEIQQTSDVTYRIYDFKRQDANGNYRELHTELAAESINYEVQDDYQTRYDAKQNEGVALVECPYFTTAVYDLTEPMTLDYSELDSFVILIGVGGEGSIIDEDGDEHKFAAGETVLIPATAQHVTVTGNVKFLETFV